MKPILWFVLGILVATAGQAVAQIVYPAGPVDSYGNAPAGETYRPVPGGSQYRDSSGNVHYYESSQKNPC